MSVALITDERFERHDTGPGHPERPERLEHFRKTLTASGLESRCVKLEPQPADDAQLLRVHDAEHPAEVQHLDLVSHVQ